MKHHGIRDAAQLVGFEPEEGPSMRMSLTIVLGFLLLITGTARAQGVVLPLPPEDQQKITAQLGPGVVGNALPSQPIGDVSTYFPLTSRSLTYQITSGPKAGNSESSEVARVRRPGGRLAWRLTLSPSLTGFIAQGMDGWLVMPAVSDPGEGVVVVTTPANPFVPKGMQPGEDAIFLAESLGQLSRQSH
jgi:hypothetical protein